MTDITNEVVETLGAKLDAMDLTDAEAALLDAVLAQAAGIEPEVEGFQFRVQQDKGLWVTDWDNLKPRTQQLVRSVQRTDLQLD